MKKLLAIVVLGFFLITPSQANEINDFQIGGMSVNDSLLNYFDKNSIDKELNTKFTFIYNKENLYWGSDGKKIK